MISKRLNDAERYIQKQLDEIKQTSNRNENSIRADGTIKAQIKQIAKRIRKNPGINYDMDKATQIAAYWVREADCPDWAIGTELENAVNTWKDLVARFDYD